MWHMTFCSVVGFLCIRVLGLVKSHNMSARDYMQRVMPIGVLYAASLWLSNSAYLYLSVSFIQMTKSLMPGLVYASGILLGTEQYQVGMCVCRGGGGGASGGPTPPGPPLRGAHTARPRPGWGGACARPRRPLNPIPGGWRGSPAAPLAPADLCYGCPTRSARRRPTCCSSRLAWWCARWGRPTW